MRGAQMADLYVQNPNISRIRFSGGNVDKADVSARRRISLEQRVVIFMLIDLAIMAFFGLTVGKAVEVFEGAAVQPRFGVVLFAMALFILASRSVSAYKTASILDRSYSPRQVALAFAMTFLILILIGAATKTSHTFSRQWFFAWACLTGAVAPLMRVAAIEFTRRQFEQGAFVYRVFGHDRARRNRPNLSCRALV